MEAWSRWYIYHIARRQRFLDNLAKFLVKVKKEQTNVRRLSKKQLKRIAKRELKGQDVCTPQGAWGWYKKELEEEGAKFLEKLKKESDNIKKTETVLQGIIDTAASKD